MLIKAPTEPLFIVRLAPVPIVVAPINWLVAEFNTTDPPLIPVVPVTTPDAPKVVVPVVFTKLANVALSTVVVPLFITAPIVPPSASSIAPAATVTAPTVPLSTSSVPPLTEVAP